SRGSVTSLYDADGIGSVTSLYDSAGTQAATYSFSSFGNSTSTVGLSNPFQYTGREWDSDTGIFYYRARYYQPSTGRFISEDPITFRGGRNFYRYVRNNPLNRTDPTGLTPVWPTKWLACLQCVIYMRKCAEEGTGCKQELDKKYPNDLDLC